MMVQRRTRQQPSVPLASMGDIAFLLIIFFILTTHFMKESHIEADLAESMDGEIMEPKSVSVVVDKNGVIWLQGRECSADMLESGVAALIMDSEEKTVMVKIHAELSHAEFGDVINAVTGAGAEIALIGKEGADEF